MRFISTFLIALLILAALPRAAISQGAGTKTEFHTGTNWRIQPSLVLDTLCLLNVLTGDPFYVRYYKEEHARFEPQLTSETRAALANLKRKIKDENKNIISAFLALHFSATADRNLDDMLRTLKDSARMKSNLKGTDYYSAKGWRLFESVREELRVIFLFLKAIKFEDYWRQAILPKVEKRISATEKELGGFNVIAEVEQLTGFRLSSDIITVYLLNYSQPHGIRITGTRFIADIAYPFRIVLQNAVHEMLHPPYRLAKDKELKKRLDALRRDEFLMDKVENHNPSFGYNSFESYVEENGVRALDQMVGERFGIAREARARWREEDEGMHVLAAVLYSLMKEEKFDGRQESFRDFLLRVIGSGKLGEGKVKARYEAFYR